MLKSTQTVFFQWNSLSLGYSLISLQPGMMMLRCNQALKVVTKLLNFLLNGNIIILVMLKCSLCQHYAKCSD